MDIIAMNGRLSALRYGGIGKTLEFPEGWDLFTLKLRDGDGVERSIGYKEMSLVAEDSSSGLHTTSLLLELPEGAIKARITMSEADPQVKMMLDVENDTELELVSADFPRVPVSGINAAHALYFSSPWGSRNHDPIKLIRENHNGEAFRRYPADLAMQYTMIGDGKDLYYISAYQTGDETFDAVCTVTGDDSVVLANRWYPYIRRGSWSTSDNGIALLAGDWHAGADLYRSVMGEIFQPPKQNPWLAENFEGWVQVGLKLHDRPAENRFTDLPALYDRVAETGLNVMHVYGWAGWAHDSLYPDYDINPELGTEEELRAALDEIKARGGRAAIYTNGRLIDLESNFYRNVSSNSSIIAEDGTRPTEHYGTGVFFEIACPSASAYREYFKTQVEKIITRLHGQAIQIDQVSCNLSHLCFSTEHEHDKPSNNWLPGIDRFLTELRELYLSHNPEFWVWIEGVNERFGQFYDVSQGHIVGEPWNIGNPFPEQFIYTYPNYTIVGASSGFEEMCYTFIQGKPFDFHLSELDDERYRRIVTELVAVRKSERKYFAQGRYMDTVGLQIRGKEVKARSMASADGGHMVNFWSPGSSDNDEHIAVVSGDSVCGISRPVYPGDVSVTAVDDGYEVRWKGSVAIVAWE